MVLTLSPHLPAHNTNSQMQRVTMECICGKICTDSTSMMCVVCERSFHAGCVASDRLHVGAARFKCNECRRTDYVALYKATGNIHDGLENQFSNILRRTSYWGWEVLYYLVHEPPTIYTAPQAESPRQGSGRLMLGALIDNRSTAARLSIIFQNNPPTTSGIEHTNVNPLFRTYDRENFEELCFVARKDLISWRDAGMPGWHEIREQKPLNNGQVHPVERQGRKLLILAMANIERMLEYLTFDDPISPIPASKLQRCILDGEYGRKESSPEESILRCTEYLYSTNTFVSECADSLHEHGYRLPNVKPLVERALRRLIPQMENVSVID